jgi:hypothetical protein
MTPKQPPAATIDSFCLEPEQEPEVMRRSRVQAWATCPAMARFIELGLVNTSSDIANAGEEVHKAVSAGIQFYLDI